LSPQKDAAMLYRLKVLNKICYRIYYSEPARLHFSAVH
jgi:hypothetical protein